MLFQRHRLYALSFPSESNAADGVGCHGVIMLSLNGWVIKSDGKRLVWAEFVKPDGELHMTPGYDFSVDFLGAVFEMQVAARMSPEQPAQR